MPIDPRTVEFVLWEPPPAGHALLNHPSVSIGCRALVDSVDLHKPPGYPDYGASTAANVAKRIADWMEYQGLTPGSSRTPGATGGWVTLQNLGTDAHLGATHNMQLSTLDQVAGGTGRYTLYNANGCAAGAGTLLDYCTTLAPLCAAELLSRGLRTFRGMLNDDEERSSSVGFGCKSDSPADADGNWPETIAAARYPTEILFTDGPAAADSGLTLQQAVAAQPAFTPTTTEYFFREVNRDWINQVYVPIESRVMDYALHRTVYTPFRAVFPAMQCGNFDLQMPLSADYPFADSQNNWLKWHQRGNTSALRAQVQNPSFYGPVMTENTNPNYAPSQNPTHGLGTARPEIWRNFIAGRIRACTALKNPTPMVGDFEIPNLSAGGEYTPTSDDVLYAWRTAYAAGERTFSLFNYTSPMTTRQADDTLRAILAFLRGGGTSKPARTVQTRIHPRDPRAMRQVLEQIGTTITPASAVAFAATEEAAQTRRITVQVQDRARQNWGGRWAVEIWLAATPNADPDATGNTAVFVKGTVLETIQAGAHWIVLTDETGVAELDLSLSSPGTRYIQSVPIGQATASEAITWT